MKAIFLLCIFVISLSSKVLIQLSHYEVKNGTSFAIIFQSDTKLTKAPNVKFKDKTYQMFTINGSIQRYEVFLPVDYYSKKIDQVVTISYIQDGKIVKIKKIIKIIDGNYKKNEIIKVAKGKVKLSKKNKNRSKKEYSKVYKNVYSQVTPYDLTNNSFFTYPMNSKITSDFGNARIYNGIAKSYHTGTDFRAKVGSNIFAANSGKIALVMKRFYLGKVVYIDHGRGTYTYYAHMSKIDVVNGQKIHKGELLGQSGKTGRITGPHLHYAVRLYNTTVDPIQYTQLYNEIAKKYH